MQDEVQDMSNSQMNGDRPASEGPIECYESIRAKATNDLADFLKLHDIEVDYYEADWKDGQELAEGTRKLCLKHPSWSMYYFVGDTWGIDDNFVFFASKPVEDEVIEKIGELIVGFGAELPKEYTAPKPKCPNCGKELDGLEVSYDATVGGYASILNGELDISLQEDTNLYDILLENTAIFCCTECGEELFADSEDDRVTAFLKGEGEK